MPLVFVGAAFGFWVTKRLNDQLFSKIVYAITFCLGWYLLVDGAWMLAHLTVALTALITSDNRVMRIAHFFVRLR